MTEEPRPISVLRRSVPAHVGAAARCALEKLPADRFATAAQFADALNGRAAPSSLPSSATTAGTRSSRTLRAYAAAATAAIMLVGARGGESARPATVSIPHHHRPGRLESPRWRRLEFEQDPTKHLMVVSLERTPHGTWLATVDDTIRQLRFKDVMVFVHGFNVGFEDALRRCAQFAYDVKVEGLLVAFSWPSKRLLRAYLADESTVLGRAPHSLASVLNSLRLRPGVGNIQVVAHSMGARLVNAALSILAQEHPEFSADPLVFAAPDIDQEAFVESARNLVGVVNRVSLYVSAMDFALATSAFLHNYRRVGTGGKRLLVVDGVDTMDASRFGLNWLGHGYFAENNAAIDDLFLLLNKRLAPPDRNLRRVPYPPSCYWAFQ